MLAALVGVVTVRFGEARTIGALLADVHWPWMAAALVVQLGTYLATPWLWHRVLLRTNVVHRWWTLVPLALGKLFLDHTVPSSGISGTAAICVPRCVCGLAGGVVLPCWALPIAGRVKSSAAESSTRGVRRMKLTCWDSWDRRRLRARSNRCSVPDP